MATDILLPQWGMEMQEGTVVRWLKGEGDAVREGEPLVEIETSKLTSEMESTASGVLARIVVPVGRTVPVRTVLAVVAAPGETLPTPAEQEPAGPGDASTAPPPSSARAARPGVQVTPVARRLAREHDVDLDTVQGTGPGGRITDADVRRVVESAPAAEPLGDEVAQVVPLSGMRGAIARRMLESAQGAAAVTLTTEADVTELVHLQRDMVGAWRPHRIRPMEIEFLVAAVARALDRHPRLNAVLVDNQVRVLTRINIGVAMGLPDGLIVPVVRDADRHGLLEIARAVRDLASRSKEIALSPEETMDASFTVTSLGAVDVDAFTPIINPPQVAILGVGRTVEKPAVYDGEVAKRSMMFLSLTFDHRALDGVPAGEFLRTVRRALEDPEWMRELAP